MSAERDHRPGSLRLDLTVRRYPKATRITLVVLALLVLALGCAVVAIVPSHGKHDPIGLVVVVSGFVSTGLIVLTLVERTTSLEVTPDALVVDGGLGGRHPRAGARLVSWTMPDGKRRGSALILAGAAPFVLGGLDHTPRGPAPGDAVTRVDAYLAPGDFDRLLAEIASGAPAPAGTFSCALGRGSSLAAGLGLAAPWLVTLAVAAGVFVAREEMRPTLGEPGLPFAIAMIALVAAGLAVTLVSSLVRSRAATGWIELDHRGLRVTDRRGRVLVEGPLDRVIARPLSCTHRGKFTFVMPAIGLAAPGAREVVIGANESRLAWTTPAAPCSSPRFVVGGADWLALLERLNLRGAVRAR